MRNILNSLRLLILAAIVCLASSANAQPGLTNQGREFWLGFMPNFDSPADQIMLHIVASAPSTVTVEVFGDNGIIVDSRSKTLSQYEKWDPYLSVSQAETRDAEKAVSRAIHVTSTEPCVVYGQSLKSLTGDLFLALPSTALGLEYYCFSYYDDAFWTVPDNHLGGEFLIVAPYDGTTVNITTNAATTISPDGKVLGHAAGDNWTVQLDRGQTYLVQSTGWQVGVADLTGSRITATKPIAVMTGHQRAGIDMEFGESKEHLLEMSLPVSLWGHEYYGVPFERHRSSGVLYRLISAEEDNRISIRGQIDTVVTLSKGQMFELARSTQATSFASVDRKRFQVMSYSYTGGTYGDADMGDPFMSTLIPSSSFVDEALFQIPNIAFYAYASFVSTSSGIDHLQVLIDDELRPLSELSPIISDLEGSSMRSATINVTGKSTSALRAVSTEPFALNLYGYSSKAGYGYPAAMSFTTPGDTTGSLNVRVGSEQQTHIWPNPASQFTTFSNDSGNLLMRVDAVDISGSVHTLAFEQNKIDVASLASGFYILRIISNSQQFEAPLVIKR